MTVRIFRALLLVCMTAPLHADDALPEAPDSPRAAMTLYLRLCRQGRLEEAGRLLSLPEGIPASQSPALARHLKAVLDRHVWFDLEALSPEPGGNVQDELPPELEEVGRVPAPGGGSDPVRLLRREENGKVRWAVSPATVDRIEGWYDRLGGRWIRDYLPEPLLRPGPKEILWWQWLALPVLLFLSWILGCLLGKLSQMALSRVARRSSAEWDDVLVDRMRFPLAVAWGLLAFSTLLPFLDLYAPAEAFLGQGLRAGLWGVLFWTLLRGIDVGHGILARLAWSRAKPSLAALLPLANRLAKALILALALVAVLSALGYPVASLIAGLGIGGLALALAAQKTVENLFGSISLGVDQPFRVGDFVKVEDFVGTVEAIGLRSTRFRTLDRTVISIPNGKLADMRLESFSERDRMRLACTVGLVYGTTAAQMRETLAGLERVLREHPKIWPDTVVVKLKEMAASSLDIEVMAWFRTPDWGEFQAIRQEVLIGFLEVVERAGTSVAFPTQTVHVLGQAG